MSRMLEFPDGIEVEVSDETYIRVKLASVATLIGVAQSLEGKEPSLQKHFVDAASGSLSDVRRILSE